MKKTTKITLGVIGSLAVVGGLIATSVAANQVTQDEMPSLFSRAAKIIGIEEDEMKSAFDQAWEEEVDQMLEEDKITAEKAEEMKENGFQYGRGRAGVRAKDKPGIKAVHTVAQYLEIEMEDLMKQWNESENLEAVIETNGGDVEEIQTLLIENANDKIDEAVDNGKMTAEKAEEISETIEEKITELLYEASAPERAKDRPVENKLRDADFEGPMLGNKGEKEI